MPSLGRTNEQRRRCLGHVLRLPAESSVRRSLLALVKGNAHYPEGSHFSDCEAGLPQLEALSRDRSAYETRDQIKNLRLICEKQIEHSKNVYCCFNNYSKAFYCVDFELMWRTLLSFGIPKYLVE